MSLGTHTLLLPAVDPAIHYFIFDIETDKRTFLTEDQTFLLLLINENLCRPLGQKSPSFAFQDDYSRFHDKTSVCDDLMKARHFVLRDLLKIPHHLASSSDSCELLPDFTIHINFQQTQNELLSEHPNHIEVYFELTHYFRANYKGKEKVWTKELPPNLSYERCLTILIAWIQELKNKEPDVFKVLEPKILTFQKILLQLTEA